MYIEDDELRGLYQTSAAEHIEAIESALMQLEKQPQNLDILKELLRSAHTLKGDSRMLGVEDVETLVHQIEECLMPIAKGQATMTDELCDRLYAGLDTIKKLADTAVTGSPNDVNMFYVLATLMGDARANPALSVPTTPSIEPDLNSSDLFDSEQFGSTDIQVGNSWEPESNNLDADLDEFGFASWVNETDEEPLFDRPTDLWVHESNDLPVAMPIDNDALSPPAKTPLQASFLELASELFPADSTLPVLDPQMVFNDFTLVPGSTPTAELFDDGDALDLLAFLADDDLTLVPGNLHVVDELDLFADTLPSEIDVRGGLSGLVPGNIPLESPSSTGDPQSSDEDFLFADFDSTLVPASDDFVVLEAPSSSPELPIESAPVLEPVAPKLTTPTPAPTPTERKTTDTIRVEAKQLDALMGQSGEINVINQQISSRLGDLEAILELWENSHRDAQQLFGKTSVQSPLYRQLQRNHQQWEQLGVLISKFKKSIDGDSSRLDLVTSALESGVKKLRLLPMTTIFNLFPRMVRDLAKDQSKEINFAIEGGDLLLDKRLLEEIKDPLMHILRNAIDHGIETPKERQLNGKLPAATLLIQVRQTGNTTTIEIADDGRGLDVKRIKATAIKRGLHTQAELEAMSIDRIQSLIFAPGFSTKSRVTELSGRGVGLDIVRTNIERIKGSVDVESLPDGGCTFRIVLSHAIGTSQVTIVDIRDQTYAIPIEYIDRMLLVNKAEIFALGSTTTTQINGKTITVAWLADLLGLPPIAPNSPKEITRTSNSIACLLLQSGRQQLALLVDRIQDRQLISIESPHPLLKNVPHLAGSTILGTGKVCLVLNPVDLFNTAAGGNRISTPTVATTTLSMAAALPPAILLVEDSLVIRTQMTRILKDAGYQVTVANDGLEGWEKLQAGQFDLVVSDVEMPRWGGLELTNQIRSHSQYQDLPVVLVTTLAKTVDRDRGFQAGANAYLTKGDFDRQLLLDTLTRLI